MRGRIIPVMIKYGVFYNRLKASDPLYWFDIL